MVPFSKAYFHLDETLLQPCSLNWESTTNNELNPIALSLQKQNFVLTLLLFEKLYDQMAEIYRIMPKYLNAQYNPFLLVDPFVTINITILWTKYFKEIPFAQKLSFLWKDISGYQE